MPSAAVQHTCQQDMTWPRHDTHLGLGPEALVVVDGEHVDPDLLATLQPVAADARVCCRLPLQANQRRDRGPVPAVRSQTA